jgi:hypothetical protein
MFIPVHYFGGIFQDQWSKDKSWPNMEIIHWSGQKPPSDIPVMELFPIPFEYGHAASRVKKEMVNHLLEHGEQRASELFADCDFCYMVFPRFDHRNQKTFLECIKPAIRRVITDGGLLVGIFLARQTGLIGKFSDHLYITRSNPYYLAGIWTRWVFCWREADRVTTCAEDMFLMHDM